jgi:hypothetical protein
MTIQSKPPKITIYSKIKTWIWYNIINEYWGDYINDEINDRINSDNDREYDNYKDDWY